MSIGPFKTGNYARIPLAVTVDGQTTAVDNPRVQRLIKPDGTDASGFPKPMVVVEAGIYYLDLQLMVAGNYIAIVQAELGGQTLEDIEEFVMELPFGFPRIEGA